MAGPKVQRQHPFKKDLGMNRTFALPLVLTLLLAHCVKNPDSSQIASSASKTKLDVNDVSILFPITVEKKLVPLHVAGNLGPFLSEKRFEEFMNVSEWNVNSRKAADLYKSLRVISLRVDPCFPDLINDKPGCVPQVRLIVMPTEVETFDGVKVSVTDATLHLLYDIPKDDWPKLVQDLRQLKADQKTDLTSGVSLGIHPHLAAESSQAEGPYQDRLLSIVRSYVGEQRLARLAFMQTPTSFSGTKSIWQFGAVDVHQGALVRTKPLPHIEKDQDFDSLLRFQVTQSFKGPFNPFGPLDFSPHPDDIGDDTRNGVISPKLTAKDQVAFLVDSRNWAKNSQSPEVIEAFTKLLRVENPEMNDIKTTDCVSCHISTQLKTVLKKYKLNEEDNRFQAARYAPPAGVAWNRVETQGKIPGKEHWMTVNFGYFVDLPSISQRTINESAKVAAELNQLP